jgi:hypothetical protein
MSTTLVVAGPLALVGAGVRSGVLVWVGLGVGLGVF